MKYSIKSIAGLTCIFAPMEDSHATIIEIMVRAGSNYETREINGISHFLEHMFFKWGASYTTPKSVAEAVDAFGGEFNAYTGNEYAGYYVKSSPEHIYKAIDVLSDMMCHPLFPKDEMEREKGVVIQELKMYEDNPQAMVSEKWQNYYLGDNSFGWPIIGTESNILSFSQDALFAHKANLYTKDNLIIVVAGKIEDQGSIEEAIADHFANLPEKMKGTLPTFEHTLPKEHRAHYTKGTEQNHLIISAPGFNGTHEDRYAASLAMNILGGPMSARLFQNIREKLGLCYYIGGTHMSSPAYGTFFMRAGIDKERFPFGVEKIYEEIARFATGDISEQEFATAQGNIAGRMQIGLETCNDVSDFLGMQYLMYGEISSVEEKLEKYKAVTLDAVKHVAKKLSADNLYMYHIE